MVKTNGEVLAADFGIARMMESSTTTTMAGAGTPAYMAPEQVLGKKPQPQTDIYALGIVLYEMLTGGERPFTGEQAKMEGSTSEKVRWEQVEARPPSPRKYNPAISSGLEAVIMKCLQKDPAQRYASALEFLQAAELAIGNLEETRDFVVAQPAAKPAPAVEKNAVKQKKPAPKFNSRLLGIGGIVVIVLFFVAYGLTHLPSTPTPSPTAQATSTFELPTETPEPPTATLELPTETLTVTFAPPTPTLGIGSFMISARDGMKLLYVPSGQFTMGSNDGYDEQPVHAVYLDAFWIDQTDITNKMYALCVSAGACTSPSNTNSYTRSSYYGSSEFDTYPVIYVDWNMAKTYCTWASRQLPTEAQWEKAARGTDGRIYPWGNNSPDSTLLNYNWIVGDTTAVGSYPNGASPYGALDMAGNVQQWVNDWYSDSYYQISPSSNPPGPASGQGRVLRGGWWSNNVIDIRSESRIWVLPAFSSYYSTGFRCALAATP